jgi:predicted component of type VI protein secretion system
MPGQLVSLSESPNILLDKPILILGRHPECDVQLNSRKISRRHCCIAQVSDSLLVRDLGSTNGIRINGSRVLEGRLKNGDELTVGNFRFTLNLDDAVLPPSGPPPVPSPPRPELRNSPPAKTPVPVAVAPPKPNDLPRLEESDPLEDAEEPVELEDDSKMAPPKPMRAPVPPPTPPQLPSVGKQSTATTDSGSLFPDHLTLRPQSGQHPKPPGVG